jgi:hypothetical protein
MIYTFEPTSEPVLELKISTCHSLAADAVGTILVPQHWDQLGFRPDRLLPEGKIPRFRNSHCSKR